jgi:MFS family permease
MITVGRWRLAAMMGLVYAVQGSFWPLLAIHLSDLGIGGRGRGWIFATLAIGSLVAPLSAGQLVDRMMATQRYLALTYAAGTVLLVVIASGAVSQAGWLFVVFVVYWSLIGPSYSLSSALAMRHLRDPGREFGWVRLWGTAGWMIAGWVVSLVMLYSGSTTAGHGAFGALWVATVVSVVITFYCLTLPHTPPLARGALGRDAFKQSLELMRQPDTAVLLLTSFGLYLTVPMQFQVIPGYLEFRGLPRAWISTTMTLGQMTEIGTLALLPFLLRRLGPKGTMALGIAAWLVRFSSLALVPPLWLAVGGTLLHGVGFACFTVGSQVYIDGRCEPHLRASAQALHLVFSSGMGALLGNLLAGEVASIASPGDVLVFLIPCVIDGALLLYFLRGFRAPVSSVTWVGAPNAQPPSLGQSVRGTVACAGHLVTESADG